MAAVALLSSAALLTACAQEEELRPPRSVGEGAWYSSSKEERRGYCEAYRARDPQRPIHLPTYASAESEDEFADDFYEVLREKC
ncbi:hypothetical protein [Streptomyces cyslabdanicus]|uniref:hypothetical protein n=1 Tax=Streptomyces cyslabdanicus TaxID=1470456 RepID=UPI0040446A00